MVPGTTPTPPPPIVTRVAFPFLLFVHLLLLHTAPDRYICHRTWRRRHAKAVSIQCPPPTDTTHHHPHIQTQIYQLKQFSFFLSINCWKKIEKVSRKKVRKAERVCLYVCMWVCICLDFGYILLPEYLCPNATDAFWSGADREPLLLPPPPLQPPLLPLPTEPLAEPFFI